jgi:hypothetical protein
MEPYHSPIVSLLRWRGFLLRSANAYQTLARIDRDSGEPHFVMQVRAGALALIPHFSDPLSFADGIASTD